MAIRRSFSKRSSSTSMTLLQRRHLQPSHLWPFWRVAPHMAHSSQSSVQSCPRLRAFPQLEHLQPTHSCAFCNAEPHIAHLSQSMVLSCPHRVSFHTLRTFAANPFMGLCPRRSTCRTRFTVFAPGVSFAARCSACAALAAVHFPVVKTQYTFDVHCCSVLC
jgi:hypothetical protein